MGVEKLPLTDKGPVLSLAYSERLRLLAIGQMGDSSGRPCLTLWDPYKRKRITVVEKEAYRNIWAICFDYRDKYLVYSDNHNLFRYDISSGEKRMLKIDNGKIARIVSSKSAPRMIVSGKQVLVLDIDTEEIFWKLDSYEDLAKTDDLEIKGLPAEWDVPDKLSYFNEPACTEIFGDGKNVLVSGHNKGNIEQIEVDTRKVVRTIFPAPVQAAWMSLGCNETVVAVSSRLPRANFLWELETGQRILPETFNEQSGSSSCLCLHSKERLLAIEIGRAHV